MSIFDSLTPSGRRTGLVPARGHAGRRHDEKVEGNFIHKRKVPSHPCQASGVRHFVKIGNDGGGAMAEKGTGIVFGKEMKAFHVEVALDEPARNEAARPVDDLPGGHVRYESIRPSLWRHPSLTAVDLTGSTRKPFLIREVGRRFHCSSRASMTSRVDPFDVDDVSKGPQASTVVSSAK